MKAKTLSQRMAERPTHGDGVMHCGRYILGIDWSDETSDSKAQVGIAVFDRYEQKFLTMLRIP